MKMIKINSDLNRQNNHVDKCDVASNSCTKEKARSCTSQVQVVGSVAHR